MASAAMMDLQQQQQQPPMSRTHQYRKVMKPLLERKRRARINKCLDELKDLMVSALQNEGESITKLEKADVLELTVRHLRKLKKQNALGLTPQATYAGKFKDGYAHCAQEVSKFITESSGLDVHISTRLLSHLTSSMQALQVIPPSLVALNSPPVHSPPLQTSGNNPEATNNSDEALDLSSGDRRKRLSNSSDSSDEIVRKQRQNSNDSDSGNGSSLSDEDKANNEAKDQSWRPWRALQ